MKEPLNVNYLEEIFNSHLLKKDGLDLLVSQNLVTKIRILSSLK